MTAVICRQSISIDGFTAGPNQSSTVPLGEGGVRVHQWQFDADKDGREGDAAIIAEFEANVGAYIMGRNMFGPDRGPWDLDWTGWWGDNPPYHAPVFVLGHHPREPLTKEGGTSFTFVTDGIESALERARAVAGDKRVAIAGGAATIRQYLSAGLIDELYLHVAPFTLGVGERLFDGIDFNAELDEVVASPTVTHIKYRINR